MTRENKLLIAAWKLLNKQNESYYVLDLLCETVHYDGTECDGSCLMDDIESLLDENGINVTDDFGEDF